MPRLQLASLQNLNLSENFLQAWQLVLVVVVVLVLVVVVVGGGGGGGGDDDTCLSFCCITNSRCARPHNS